MEKEKINVSFNLISSRDRWKTSRICSFWLEILRGERAIENMAIIVSSLVSDDETLIATATGGEEIPYL